MRDPSIIFPELWIAHEFAKGDAIHNPGDIIYEEPIHNVPIMDQGRAFIMQGELLWMRDTCIMS